MNPEDWVAIEVTTTHRKGLYGPGDVDGHWATNWVPAPGFARTRGLKYPPQKASYSAHEHVIAFVREAFEAILRQNNASPYLERVWEQMTTDPGPSELPFECP